MKPARGQVWVRTHRRMGDILKPVTEPYIWVTTRGSNPVATKHVAITRVNRGVVYYTDYVLGGPMPSRGDYSEDIERFLEVFKPADATESTGMHNLKNLFEDLLHGVTLIESGMTQQTTDVELMQSLNALVKSNGGRFKSPAQARFLYKKLDYAGYKQSAPQHLAQQWVKNPNDILVGLSGRIESFGKRTASKVRYYGFVYVVDGGGVVMRAKAKVQAGKGTGAESQFGGQIVGVEAPNFVREGDAPTLYDAHGERKAMEARAQKHAPLISKIQSIQGYQGNNFLQSLVGQLQTGHELSAGQERALARMMPYESTKSGSYQEKYQAALKDLENVMSFAKKAKEQILADASVSEQIKEAATWYIDTAVRGFDDWRKRPTYAAEVSGAGILNNFLFDLGWRKKARRGWSVSLLWALGQVAKKGTKAGKNATQLSGEGVQFADWLAGVTQGQVLADLLDYYREAEKKRP